MRSCTHSSQRLCEVILDLVCSSLPHLTIAGKVITQPACDTHVIGTLMPCNHHEADTRMLLHLTHASENGHQIAMIRTVDTDAVILAISTFNDLDLSELWISFGTKKSHQYYTY